MPFASRIQVSLVLVSPSTVIALKESAMSARNSAKKSMGREMSVVMKASIVAMFG